MTHSENGVLAVFMVRAEPLLGNRNEWWLVIVHLPTTTMPHNKVDTLRKLLTMEMSRPRVILNAWFYIRVVAGTVLW